MNEGPGTHTAPVFIQNGLRPICTFEFECKCVAASLQLGAVVCGTTRAVPERSVARRKRVETRLSDALRCVRPIGSRETRRVTRMRPSPPCADPVDERRIHQADAAPGVRRNTVEASTVAHLKNTPTNAAKRGAVGAVAFCSFLLPFCTFCGSNGHCLVGFGCAGVVGVAGAVRWCRWCGDGSVVGCVGTLVFVLVRRVAVARLATDQV